MGGDVAISWYALPFSKNLRTICCVHLPFTCKSVITFRLPQEIATSLRSSQ